MTTASSSGRIDRPMAGAVWMLISGLLFVAVNGIVKYLGQELPAAEAAFLRFALGLVFLLPLWRQLRVLRLPGRVWGLFALRGVVHTLGVILWFYSMVHIPIAEVQALGYLTPVLVTIGAALFLGERIAARRIGAVVVALMGVGVVLRPGVQAVSTGDLAMLGTVVFFALSYITAKHLSGRASPGIVVAMLSVTVTIGLLPFAAAVWVTPTLAQVLWLFAVAGFATLAHLAMTKAFTLAPVTVTQPVTFLQLIWGTAMGALVFGEGIDGFVLAGGGIIIAAVGFITWREAVLNRRGVTPPAPATKV